MDDRIGVFLTYKDLFPTVRTTPSSLRTALSTYDGKQLLRLLGAISWYFGETVFSIGPALELGFVSEYADAALAWKVKAWLETQRAHKLFHRSTIPALYQLLMLAQPGSCPASC